MVRAVRHFLGTHSSRVTTHESRQHTPRPGAFGRQQLPPSKHQNGFILVDFVFVGLPFSIPPQRQQQAQPIIARLEWVWMTATLVAAYAASTLHRRANDAWLSVF
jgi:hypothetical protein